MGRTRERGQRLSAEAGALQKPRRYISRRFGRRSGAGKHAHRVCWPQFVVTAHQRQRHHKVTPRLHMSETTDYEGDEVA